MVRAKQPPADDDSAVGAMALALGAFGVMGLGGLVFAYLFLWSGDEPVKKGEAVPAEVAVQPAAPPADQTATAGAAAIDPAETPVTTATPQPVSHGVPEGHTFLVVAARGKTAEAEAEQVAADDEAALQEEFNDPSLRVSRLEHPGAHFAYDPHTKRLAVAERETGQVRFYEVGDQVKAVGVASGPAEPTAILARRYKGRSLLFVGGASGGRIEIYDIEAAKGIGAALFENPSVSRIDSSDDEKDPWVYYASRTEVGEYLLYRFSIDTLKSTAMQLPESYDDFSVSSKGDVVYCRYALSSPEGLRAWRVGGLEPGDPSRSHCERIYEEHESSGRYAPHPQGLFVGCGSQVRSADLRTRQGAFAFSVQAFAVGKPWVFGLQNGQLFVGSLNGYKLVKNIVMPSAFSDVTNDNAYQGAGDGLDYPVWRDQSDHHPIFIDDDRLVLAAENQAVVLPLDALDLPEEPLLAIDLPSEVAVDLGEQPKMVFRGFAQGAETALVKAPEGALLEGDTITWPLSKGPGYEEIAIERSQGSCRFRQSATIKVGLPEIRLGFKARDVRFSADGKVAVASGGLSDESGENNSQYVAVLDVASRTVLATTEVEAGHLFAAAIDGKSVYALVGKSTNYSHKEWYEVVQLDRESLRPVSRASVEALSNVPEIEVIGRDSLVVCGNVLSTNGLRKPDLPLREFELGQYGVPYYVGRRVIQTPEGVIWNGVVWDAEYERAEMLLHAPGFAVSTEDMKPAQRVTAWGCEFSEDYQLKSPSLAGPLGQLGSVVVSRSKPVAFSLTAARYGYDDWPTLGIVPLDRDQARQEIRLMEPNAESREASRLEVSGTMVAIVLNEKLLLLDASTVTEEVKGDPLRFELRQPVKLLDAGRSTSVSYTIQGGEPPFDFTMALGEEVLESKGDKSGAAKFSVDSKAIAKRLTTDLRKVSWPRTDGGPRSGRQVVAEYQEAIEPAYKKFVGGKPRGIPVEVRASVKVTDARGSTITLNHAYLIELPEDTVVSSLATQIRDRLDETNSRISPFERVRLDATATAERRRQDREREKQLDQELMLVYSDKLRETHPPVEVKGDNLADQANAARDAVMAFLEEHLEGIQAQRVSELRTWSDRQGHKTKASLQSNFAGKVVLRMSSGRDVELPAERLSDQDQTFLKRSQEPIDLSRGEDPEAAAQLLVLGINRHTQRTRSFPPAWIVDKEGMPILSWRVALLADLGGEDLLRLFHLDEPWDSEHNRKLLPYMPKLFATDPGPMAEGRATLLTVAGPNTALSTARPKGSREITDSGERVIALIEAKPERAVEWTKPGDCPASSIAITRMARERDGRVVVGTLARGTTIKANTPPGVWLQLAHISDSKP